MNQDMIETFCFERPSLERKTEIIEFLDEFIAYHSEINGSGGLDKIYEGVTFEEALAQTLSKENEENASTTPKKCNGKTFLMVRVQNHRIVGTINVRWNLSKEMQESGGNIGYSIRPTERQKGYNKINLYFGLLEAQKLGLEQIMIDCSSDNIGSYKTMEALGGVLGREEIDPLDGQLTKYYYFNVDECIQKHKDKYDSYLNHK